MQIIHVSSRIMDINERRKAHQGTNSSHISTQKLSPTSRLIFGPPCFPRHCVGERTQCAEEDEGGQRHRQAGRQTGVPSWSSSHLVPSALYGLPELLGSNDLHQSLSVTTVRGATRHPAAVWLKPAPSQVSYYLAFVLILMQRLCYLPLGQGNESQCHFRDGLCRIAVI